MDFGARSLCLETVVTTISNPLGNDCYLFYLLSRQKHEDVILVVMTPKAKEGRNLLKHDVQELGRRCSDLTKLIIIGRQYQHDSEEKAASPDVTKCQRK